MFFGVFTHILWEIAEFFVVLDILLESCQCGVSIETPDVGRPEVVSERYSPGYAGKLNVGVHGVLHENEFNTGEEIIAMLAVQTSLRARDDESSSACTLRRISGSRSTHPGIARMGRKSSLHR